MLTRRRQPEWMDDPKLDSNRHVHALAGLQRINSWSRSAHMVWPAIEQLARAESPHELRILDLATGGGDVAIGLARLARRRNIGLRIQGWDRSPVAIAEARMRAESAGIMSVDFEVHDVFEDELPNRFDVVMCSLFLHHLDEEPAVELLRRMRTAARRLVLIDDLRRSQFGYWLAWVGTRLLSRSPVVHNDGPLSVQGAYTPAEALEMARRAGLPNASVTTHWPERYLMVWKREDV